jgi:hypothetical protein
MASEMTGLERFKATVMVSKYIDLNLEVLARVVEGMESRNPAYNRVLADLKVLFPGEDVEALTQALVTEQCRVEYLKMMHAKRPISRD